MRVSNPNSRAAGESGSEDDGVPFSAGEAGGVEEGMRGRGEI